MPLPGTPEDRHPARPCVESHGKAQHETLSNTRGPRGGLSRQKHRFHADFPLSMQASGDTMLPDTVALQVSRPSTAILSHSSNNIAISQSSVKLKDKAIEGRKRSKRTIVCGRLARRPHYIRPQARQSAATPT